MAGSLAYDRIFNYHKRFADAILPSKIHILNVSFGVTDVRQSFGGTAGNIAFTLRLLGRRALIVSSAGNDFQPYAKWLTRHQLDRSGIAIIKTRPTAAAYIITDRDDNQITAFQPGALNEAVQWSALRHLPVGRIAYAIIAPGNPFTMLRLSRLCRRHKTPYLFDPGQAIPALRSQDMRSMIGSSSGVISNDYELALLLKQARVSWRQMQAAVPYIVTTLGQKGALIYQGKKVIRIPAAKPHSEIDPTGAGDAWRAGFVAGLTQGAPLRIAGQMGAVASVYTVERVGTQTHSFTPAEFAKRYQRNYGQLLQLNSEDHL